MAFDGCGRRHRGTDQMRAATFALASFEVAVAGARTSFARSKLIGVHRQAHTATRLAPIKAGFLEDLIEAFFFGLQFDLPAARHDHRIDIAMKHDDLSPRPLPLANLRFARWYTNR